MKMHSLDGPTIQPSEPAETKSEVPVSEHFRKVIPMHTNDKDTSEETKDHGRLGKILALIRDAEKKKGSSRREQLGKSKVDALRSYIKVREGFVKNKGTKLNKEA